METKNINEIVVYYLEKIKERRNKVIDEKKNLYEEGKIRNDKEKGEK